MEKLEKIKEKDEKGKEKKKRTSSFPSHKQTGVCIFEQRENYAINNVLITSLVSMNKTLPVTIQFKHLGTGYWRSPQTMRASSTNQITLY